MNRTLDSSVVPPQLQTHNVWLQTTYFGRMKNGLRQNGSRTSLWFLLALLVGFLVLGFLDDRA
jgi:hypothetical protein